MVSVLSGWLCMLSLYQAERTRAEEQLQQKTTELDSVQQSLQVLTAQRDAEINRLMTELRRCQAQLLRQQV